jgi:hypothetical protein
MPSSDVRDARVKGSGVQPFVAWYAKTWGADRLARHARNAGKLFSRYDEPGTMTKEGLGATGHLTVVKGWTAHHAMLCDFILHTAVYVYGVLGCRDFKVERTRCTGQGDDNCTFEMTWS